MSDRVCSRKSPVDNVIRPRFPSVAWSRWDVWANHCTLVWLPRYHRAAPWRLATCVLARTVCDHIVNCVRGLIAYSTASTQPNPTSPSHPFVGQPFTHMIVTTVHNTIITKQNPHDQFIF